VSSSSSGPPDDPVFCIDEALGRRVVPDALRAAGVRVELLIDHHPRGTADATWLPDVGRRGWIVLTKDKNMRRRPAEQLAIVRNGVRAFSLTSGDLSGPEMAEAFVRAMPGMRRLVRRHPGPFIASVTRSGLVAVVYPPASRGKGT
jgi:hypothetical protein